MHPFQVSQESLEVLQLFRILLDLLTCKLYGYTYFHSLNYFQSFGCKRLSSKVRLQSSIYHYLKEAVAPKFLLYIILTRCRKGTQKQPIVSFRHLSPQVFCTATQRTPWAWLWLPYTESKQINFSYHQYIYF